MEKRRKVLIATGIYPPDIGGPATYARNLSTELVRLGWEVLILTYGDDNQETGVTEETEKKIIKVSRRQDKLSRYGKYFLAAWRLAKKSDIIYALDPLSAGLPAGLAARLRGCPAVLRLGGDWLWEKAVEAGRTVLPLAAYYEHRDDWPQTEKWRAFLLRVALKFFKLIIFSTAWQRDIYTNYFGLKKEKTAIIANPCHVAGPARLAPFKKEVVFAGRLLKLKNLARLLTAWQTLDTQDTILAIYGEGPERSNLQKMIAEQKLEKRVLLQPAVRTKELLAIIARSLFVVIPSLSEISPNLALESLAAGKAVLLTQENGLEPEIKNLAVLYNPLDVNDLKDKIACLLDKQKRAAIENKIKSGLLEKRSWRDVAAEHQVYFARIT